MESIEKPESLPTSETLFPGCRQSIQRDSLAYTEPIDISKRPESVFSMLHHSTYLWLRDRPTPVDEEGAYNQSPFQHNESSRYYYKITMGIPDEVRERLQLYTPYSPQPVGLTDQTFAGQYEGISIPEDLYEELLKRTVIHGRTITGKKLEMVFDGREND